MKVFEVTAAGFDGSTSATDDRVYWVTAVSPSLVEACIANTGATLCGEAAMVSPDDADIDFKLPEQEIALGEALLHWAGHERNKTRSV